MISMKLSYLHNPILIINKRVNVIICYSNERFTTFFCVQRLCRKSLITTSFEERYKIGVRYFFSVLLWYSHYIHYLLSVFALTNDLLPFTNELRGICPKIPGDTLFSVHSTYSLPHSIPFTSEKKLLNMTNRFYSAKHFILLLSKFVNSVSVHRTIFYSLRWNLCSRMGLHYSDIIDRCLVPIIYLFI